jgi:hypothetical protein
MDKKMTQAEFFALPPIEQSRILGKATREAIAQAHAVGLPTGHGDGYGLFMLHPDGRKEYIKIYKIPGKRGSELVDPS